VLWGHAYGLGFGRDHDQALTLKDLAAALGAFRTARKGPPLEVLGTNACAMSYIEAVHELRTSASFLVASQIAVPFAGWPYHSIFRQVRAAMGPRELSEFIVGAYVRHYDQLGRPERVAMTRINLEAAAGLPDGFDISARIDRLARAIRAYIAPGEKFDVRREAAVRDVFLAAASGDVRPLIDLDDLCVDLTELADDIKSELAEAAAGVQDLADILEVDTQRHPDLRDLHGVGIYAPFVTSDEDLRRLGLLDAGSSRAGGPKSTTPGSEEYRRLSIFVNRPSWPDLVYADLRKEVNPALMDALAGRGGGTRADRHDVVQIVLSIDSSFNKLDRLLESASELLEQLRPWKPTTKPGSGTAAALVTEPPVPAIAFGPPRMKLLARRTVIGTHAVDPTPKILQQAAVGDRAAGDTSSFAAPPANQIAGEPTTAAPVGALVPGLVEQVITVLERIEKRVGDIERATLKGLTDQRLGVGPTAPGEFRFSEFPEFPKSGHGSEPLDTPKSGHGAEPLDTPKSGHGVAGGGVRVNGDLRIDLAFARVAGLFEQVGEALQDLEQSARQLESATAAALSAPLDGAPAATAKAIAAQAIERALDILQESSLRARRTVRQVLLHPVYGLGPDGGAMSLDQRQALAAAGGLHARRLRLLSEGGRVT
jgi:hypothetical protein